MSEIKSVKTFAVRDISVYEEYKKICQRNNVKISDDLYHYMLDVVKNHTTGNDQFKIDQWVDNFDMRAVPAFHSDSQTWKNYVEKTNYENLEAVKQQNERLTAIFSHVKKVKGKTGLTLKEWFEYEVDDSLLNYFVSRADRNKGINAIAKKTKYANNVKC